MDIHERVRLFYKRLAELPPFQSHDDALAEIDRVLTKVEDEHSGVERDPSGMPAVTGGMIVEFEKEGGDGKRIER